MKKKFEILLLSCFLFLASCDNRGDYQELPLGTKVVLNGGVEAHVTSRLVMNKGQWAYWVRYKTEYGKFEEMSVLLCEFSVPTQ